MSIKICEEANIRGREHLPVDVLLVAVKAKTRRGPLPAADFLFLSLPHLHRLRAILNRHVAGAADVESVGLR